MLSPLLAFAWVHHDNYPTVAAAFLGITCLYALFYGIKDHVIERIISDITHQRDVVLTQASPRSTEDETLLSGLAQRIQKSSVVELAKLEQHLDFVSRWAIRFDIACAFALGLIILFDASKDIGVFLVCFLIPLLFHMVYLTTRRYCNKVRRLLRAMNAVVNAIEADEVEIITPSQCMKGIANVLSDTVTACRRNHDAQSKNN